MFGLVRSPFGLPRQTETANQVSLLEPGLDLNRNLADGWEPGPTFKEQKNPSRCRIIQVTRYLFRFFNSCGFSSASKCAMFETFLNNSILSNAKLKSDKFERKILQIFFVYLSDRV